MEGLKRYDHWKTVNYTERKDGTKGHTFYILNREVNLSDFKLTADDVGYTYEHRYLDGVYADFRTNSEGIQYKYGVIIEKVNK